jgi:hypothetical protein
MPLIRSDAQVLMLDQTSIIGVSASRTVVSLGYDNRVVGIITRKHSPREFLAAA